MYVDLGPEELARYRPELRPPAGLREFWASALASGDGVTLDVERAEVDDGWRTVRVENVAYTATDGRRLRAWLTTPRHLGSAPRVCVVEFPGHGGGRRDPTESLYWSALGCAHLLADVRDQGGDRTDPVAVTEAPNSGFIVRGASTPDTLYYRQVFLDAVRAVQVARELTGVETVVTAGHSQGGGLALASAALRDDVAAALADVPFLCHIRRAVTITDEGPYGEVARYLAVRREETDDVLAALDHVDVAHLAPWGSCPAFFSAALMDPICPPSTVVAAQRAWGGPTDLQIWPFNKHEGGGSSQRRLQVRWLRERGLI